MIAGIALLLIVSLYRLLPLLLGVTTHQPDWLFNFSPMAALCLCSAACLPRRYAIALPFTALILTDLILNAHYGFPLVGGEFIAKNLAFAAIAAFGWQLRSQARLKVMLPSALGSSLFFYLFTNTASWLSNPAYTTGGIGWVQAVTVGLPGYPATWMFYRNNLLSDLLFTTVFMLCVRRTTQTTPATQPTLAPARW